MQERVKKEELKKLQKKEEDLKDLERIRRENEKLEFRKMQEDSLAKDKAKKFREFNGNLAMNSSETKQGGNLQLEKQKSSVQAYFGAEEGLPRKRVHVHQIKDQIVRDEIQKDVSQARDQMVHYKNEVRRDLEFELRKEREFMEGLPDQIRDKIQG